MSIDTILCSLGRHRKVTVEIMPYSYRHFYAISITCNLCGKIISRDISYYQIVSSLSNDVDIFRYNLLAMSREMHISTGWIL